MIGYVEKFLMLNGGLTTVVLNAFDNKTNMLIKKIKKSVWQQIKNGKFQHEQWIKAMLTELRIVKRYFFFKYPNQRSPNSRTSIESMKLNFF